LGGEYGASATYLSETAGRTHRGFWSSFSYVTVIGGQLLALAVLIVLQHALSRAAMQSWGWRIPFALGGLLAVVAYWLRRHMPESPSFVGAGAARSERGSVRSLWSEHRRETWTIFAFTSGGSVLFYVYATYMQKFLVNTAGFSKDDATELSAATLLAFMLAQPLCGWLSDRWGRRTMLLIAFGGGALSTWPILEHVAASKSVTVAFWLILTALLFESAYTSISAVVKAEMFPANLRSLGVALPYAVANALFGGTAEYVALWFKSAGIERGFYVYASALAAVSFFTAIAMRDTAAHSRIIED
jgi:MHS family alpha-ketoglutarate permease-like MFS transporter